MSHAPVIAIGLDAADPQILEAWMEQGHLPHLRQLRQAGTYGRLKTYVPYGGQRTETSSTERLWVMFGTGCRPDKTGYWSPVQFNPQTYGITHDTVNGAYDYQDYPPFWALGDQHQVAVFDVPVSALSPSVQGIQILGWGGHAPHTPSHSQPAEVLPHILKTYGKNPLLHKDYGNWWDNAYCDRIQAGIQHSAATRAQICMELMQQPWDLLLTVFSETHTAGHDLWHLSQPQHPLHASQTLAQKLTPTLATDSISTDLIATDPTDLMSTNLMSTDPMLTAFQRVDQAIGDIVAAAPDGAQIVVFSVHGMGHNVTDMNSMTFLPELLYRYSFPGRVALGNGKFPAPKASPPYLHPRRKSWAGEVWQRRYDANPIKRWLMPFVPSRFDTWLNAGANPRLASPYDLRDRNLPLHWMPAMWYSPLWSQMAAFALPAFAAGHVRINLAGRDAHGVVDLADYDAVCDELSQLLHQLTDGRTGEPLVESVVRTRDRNQALQCDRDLPDADLVVLWRDRVTDVVDHPSLGRIGPLTYYRSGGHRPDGFVMLKSPRIAPGSSLPGGEVVDLAPTILDLMNQPRPDYFDGHSLLSAVAAR